MSRFYNRRADLRCYIHDMNLRTLTVTAACLILGMGSSAQTTKKGTARMTLASGPFEVKINPQSEDKGDGSTMGRMSLDKQYHGDLEATAKGEMLYASAIDVQGSGAYVAVDASPENSMAAAAVSRSPTRGPCREARSTWTSPWSLTPARVN